MTDKRKALLNSALELFSTRGYENTPTSLISKNAGVATGTLFHHFSSKEELINQLYLDCKSGLMTAIDNNIISKTTVEEKLKSIWEGMIRWGLENEDRFLFIMQYKTTSFIKKETHEQIEAQSEALISFWNELYEKKLVRDIPMELMGELMISLLEGTLSYFRKNREQFDKTKIRESAYSMFYNTILINRI